MWWGKLYLSQNNGLLMSRFIQILLFEQVLRRTIHVVTYHLQLSSLYWSFCRPFELSQQSSNDFSFTEAKQQPYLVLFHSIDENGPFHQD